MWKKDPQHGQSNPIKLYFNETKSNSIHGLSSAIKFTDLVRLGSIEFDFWMFDWLFWALWVQFFTFMTVSVCFVFLITGFTIICYLVLFRHFCFQWLIQDWWAQNNILLPSLWNTSWPDTCTWSLSSVDGLDAELKSVSHTHMFNENILFILGLIFQFMLFFNGLWY